MVAQLFLVFALLVILGFPIVLSLGIASFYYLIVSGIPLSPAITRMFAGLDSFSLMAIPFFILAGELMNMGGLTKRLVRLANALVGHFTGGLAHVNIVSSMLFAGISGSSAADVSSIGAMLIPAMESEGYSKEFAVSITATSACIGNIIPPSLFMVILGSITSVSIGGMFLGGFVPGILTGGGLMIYSYFFNKRMKLPVKKRASFSEIIVAMKDALLSMVTPVIILGGIIFGIVTPTEAGVLAVVYSLILGMFVYREISFKELIQRLLSSAQTTAVAVIVLATASIFSWILGYESFPILITNILSSVSHNPLIVHVLLIASLLFIGMVMEATSALILFVPFLYPIAMNFGIDPIHFGVTCTIALVIGLVTPPVGMLLFLTASIGNTTVKQTLRVLYPQIGIMVAVLAIVIVFPRAVLLLPGLLGR